MMNEWVRAALDIILIAVVGSGVAQAVRLIRHLRGLRQGRIEMERFVYEFNATVLRAEAGIKGLRQAARDSGDDLEKLVEKAVTLRDELQFIVEHADQLADRISKAASTIARSEGKDLEMPPLSKSAGAKTSSAIAADPASNRDKPSGPRVEKTSEAAKSGPSSRAEKELLQALQKLN